MFFIGDVHELPRNETLCFPQTHGNDGNYNEYCAVDVMNMVWSGICSENPVALDLDEGHRISENISGRTFLILRIHDVVQTREADGFGTVPVNVVRGRLYRSGLVVERSSRVDVPAVRESP